MLYQVSILVNVHAHSVRDAYNQVAKCVDRKRYTLSHIPDTVDYIDAEVVGLLDEPEDDMNEEDRVHES